MSTYTIDDRGLLQAYAESRSEAAFAELVRRHLNWVYSAAWRQVGDSHLAEDVTQSVFSLLALKASSLGSNRNLPGWLFNTTRFVALRALRTEARRKCREQNAVTMNTTTSEDDESQWTCLAPHLEQAVAALSEIDRSAVLFRFYQKLPLEDVGRRLGVSEDAAKKRVSRAIGKMREYLVQRGVTLGLPALVSVLALQTVQSAPATVAADVLKASLTATSASAFVPELARQTLNAWHWTKVKWMAGVTALSTACVLVTVHVQNSAAPIASSKNVNVAIGGTAGPSRPPVNSSGNQSFFTRPRGATAFKPTRQGEMNGTARNVETVARKSGIQIGGVIVDSNGKPISGAKVDIVRVGMSNDLLWNKLNEAAFQGQKQTTDLAGHWIVTNVPPELLSCFMASVSHPEFLATNVDFYARSETEDQLREGTFRLTMTPGSTATGRVLDDHDNPVAGATVWAGTRLSSSRQETISEANGSFIFRGVSSANLLVSVMAKGWAPDSKLFVITNWIAGDQLDLFKSVFQDTKVVVMTNPMEEIILRLTPGSVIRARVQNDMAEPLAGVQISLENHGGGYAYSYYFQTNTDSDGRFEWDGTPNEAQYFSLTAAGYSPARGQSLKPNTDNIVTMRQARKLQARVVDANTGQPVRRFSVGVGRTDGSDGYFNADFSGMKGFAVSNGEFTTDILYEDSSAVLVTADDYADQVQRLAPSTDGTIRMVIQLKPAKSLEGVVVTPDGRPVLGANVVIANGNGSSRSAANLRAGRFSSTGNSQIKIVTTDDTGWFKISSPPDSGDVTAVNNQGFASVPMDQVRATGGLVLQPYGRIEGVVRIAGEPEAGVELVLTSITGISLLDPFNSVTTDAKGRFVFNSVPAGKPTLARNVRTGPRSWITSDPTKVTVEPGLTTQVLLGDTGGVLRGNIRFEMPISQDNYAAINAQLSSLWQPLPQGLNAEQIRKFAESTDWKERQKSSKSFRASVGRDGALLFDSIPSGDYLLEVTVSAKETDPIKNRTGIGIGKPLARGEIPVTVPIDATPGSPISIGEIVLKSLATEPGK